MKYMIKKTVPLVLALILLCAAGCGKKSETPVGSAASGTATTAPNGDQNPTEPSGGATTPTMAEGVEEWIDTGTQLPSNQQTGNQQTGNQQTGNQQTGNQQTGNQQTGGQQPSVSGTLTIEEYEALTNSQKQAYFESFSTVDAFYEWLEAAEAARKPGNTVTGDGTLDLGDYVNRNP